MTLRLEIKKKHFEDGEVGKGDVPGRVAKLGESDEYRKKHSTGRISMISKIISNYNNRTAIMVIPSQQ